MQKRRRRAAVLATDEGQAKQGALYLGVERFTVGSQRSSSGVGLATGHRARPGGALPKCACK